MTPRLLLAAILSLAPLLVRASVCGDGDIEATLGEVCDDGNTRSGDGCRADCRKIERCGDGLLDANESCDDGNRDDGDRCPAGCEIEQEVPLVCGNGVIERGENCDDGNSSDGDDCPADCFLLSIPLPSGKDPRMARQRALLFTMLGAPLVAGLIVGPSMGHIYAGEKKHARRTSIARLFSAGVLGFALIEPVELPAGGVVLSITSALGLGALIVYDIIDAPRAVQRTDK